MPSEDLANVAYSLVLTKPFNPLLSMYLKNVCLVGLALSLTISTTSAQTTPADSSINAIAPVEIKAYFNAQAMLDLTTSGKVISNKFMNSQAPSSFLSSFNSTPGLRMEERSPGSYRLALRGSMIRSPFGVRNTKVYLDEIPLTDASGNTYLNLLDPVGINSIHIIKGPDGSLYGPNSGGIIRFMPSGFSNNENEKSIMLSGGSYGLFHEQIKFQHQVNDAYKFSFDQAYLRSDGYRQHTGMDKLFLQTTHQWDYNPKGTLKFLALYSDLGYETPGGLTQQQYDEDPRQSRPAGGPFPSAQDQKAAIYNKTILGGITHAYKFSDQLEHVITVFGTHTDLENPFITNYELRNEKNVGFRTYLSFQDQQNSMLQWEMQLGVEGQKGWYHIKNHENNLGERGTLTDDDKLENGQHFYFYRAKARLYDKLTAEASIGLNFNGIEFERNTPGETASDGHIDFAKSWLPRLGLSYMATKNLAVRGSVSKGFSTPTIAEVRSSNNEINSDLQAESGTNYEMGMRFETNDRRFIADLSGYSYQMKNGIVRHLNEAGNEYFVNAGEMDQKGIEASLLSQIISNPEAQILKGLIFSTNLTYQDYVFQDYVLNEVDLSGNSITSVPEWIWVNTLSLAFAKQFELNVLHNFTSSIPLNDVNTVYADKYHLLQAKASWTGKISNRHALQLFFGVDNILDSKYSLGNDINAMGNRYFNVAPGRNFYTGVKFML
ncbi:iron complex outermembrane recepter protein [Sphingobacterium lactis]|uniref:Iron complex outermembrane recepter protein n=2 Tax=Sphingobacterium lactis TaxID=797291 RepID=A0A1H6BK51_9SPHI|nr:iron complex outermembrane recepter protein [Sphingobacterium lactis]